MPQARELLDSFILDDDKSFISAHIKVLREKATLLYTVPAGYDYRLDLVSNDLYGTPHLKWLLIYVNRICDVSVVVEGAVLSYCSYSDYASVLMRASEYRRG